MMYSARLVAAARVARQAAIVACLVLFTPNPLFAQRADTSLDRAEHFVGWVDSHRLTWRAFVVSGQPDAEFRLLSLDHSSGARSQITRLPPGWRRPGGYYGVNEELLVLDGELRIGEHEMRRYSYAYHPAGYAQGDVFTATGATVLHWWDGNLSSWRLQRRRRRRVSRKWLRVGTSTNSHGRATRSFRNGRILNPPRKCA